MAGWWMRDSVLPRALWGALDQALGPAQAQVHKDADGVQLKLPLQGYAPEDVQVVWERRTLAVRALKRSASGDVEAFQRRAFLLPEGLDAARADALLEDGVLTVLLPAASSPVSAPVETTPVVPARASAPSSRVRRAWDVLRGWIQRRS